MNTPVRNQEARAYARSIAYGVCGGVLGAVVEFAVVGGTSLPFLTQFTLLAIAAGAGAYASAGWRDRFWA